VRPVEAGVGTVLASVGLAGIEAGVGVVFGLTGVGLTGVGLVRASFIKKLTASESP